MNMNNEVLEILKKVGAIIQNGHFVGNSGLHLNSYVNKDALLPHTEQVSKIGELFAYRYKDLNIDVVVAPALGGIAFSQWTAFHLSKFMNKEVLSLYTEKNEGGNQIFTRGNEKYIDGRNVLIIEDTVTTGGSVMRVVNSVKKANGNIIGVCSMINRDTENITAAKLGIPFSSLSEIKTVSYEASDCLMCKNNIPINIEVGHGRKFK